MVATYTHNEYLQFLARYGAIGLGFLLLAILTTARPIARSWRAQELPESVRGVATGAAAAPSR